MPDAHGIAGEADSSILLGPASSPFRAYSTTRPTDEIQKIPMTGIDDAWAKVVDKKAR